jgi:hypothetical protein
MREFFRISIIDSFSVEIKILVKMKLFGIFGIYIFLQLLLNVCSETNKVYNTLSLSPTESYKVKEIKGRFGVQGLSIISAPSVHERCNENQIFYRKKCRSIN